MIFMLKTLFVLAAITTGLLPKAAPVPAYADVPTVAVAVDGEVVEAGGLSYVDGGEYIVPLRAVCNALGAKVEWDEEGNRALVTAPGLDILVPFDREYMEANGRCWYIPGGVDIVYDTCMVPLSFILWAFGADAEVSGPVVSVSAAGEPLLDGESFYDVEELYWMSRIIYAEAGNQPFAGQIAVGNVVMNRTECDEFPDTVKTVIFDNRYGVQFTPAYSGSIYNSPSSDSVAAAKLALEGVETVDGALYFASRRAAQHCWASRHCEVVAEIAGHVFFGEELI